MDLRQSRNGTTAPSHRLPRFGGSVGLDVGSLDDRPPLRDLGPLKGAQRLSTLLLRGIGLLAGIGEPRADGRLGERIRDGAADLADDVIRRSLRRPKSEPLLEIESRQPRLVDGRYLGQRRQTAARSYGKRVDGSGSSL